MSLRLYKYVTVSAGHGAPATAGSSSASSNEDNFQESEVRGNFGGYVENLIMLIPGEVIVTYPLITTLAGNLPSFSFKESLSGLVAVFLTIFLRTAAILPQQRPQKSALIMSVIACVIWVYQQGGHIIMALDLKWKPALDIVLIIFVAISPYFVKKDVRVV